MTDTDLDAINELLKPIVDVFSCTNGRSAFLRLRHRIDEWQKDEDGFEAHEIMSIIKKFSKLSQLALKGDL
jgi:hypothetical protein